MDFLYPGNRGPGRTPVDWVTRLRIALGVAQGLTYLHHQCGSQKIPHGNIKSSNVLLDESLNPLIADFGIALLLTSNAPPSRVAGYCAPELIDNKRISQCADVYSFGVVGILCVNFSQIDLCLDGLHFIWITVIFTDMVLMCPVLFAAVAGALDRKGTSLC